MSTTEDRRNEQGPDGEPAGARAARSGWQVPLWLDQLSGWLWRLAVVGFALYVLLSFFGLLRLVTVPVLFALVFTAMFWPLRSFLTRHRVPASLAATCTLAVIIGIVGVVGWLASAGIARQLSDSVDWEATKTEVEDWLMDEPFDLSEAEIDDFEDRIAQTLRSGVTDMGTTRARMVAETLGAVLLTVILLFFFTKDGPEIWSFLCQRVRAERRPAMRRAGEQAFHALEGYARSVVFTGLFDAVGIGAVLVFLGVPLALPLALLTFFGAFIPIVGAAVVGLLSVVVALVTVGPQAAVILGIATLVIQQLEGNVVMPLVMRRGANLHPVVVLLALAVGGALAGLTGGLVAVPLTAMAIAAWRGVSERSGVVVAPSGSPLVDHRDQRPLPIDPRPRSVES